MAALQCVSAFEKGLCDDKFAENSSVAFVMWNESLEISGCFG